MIEKRNYIQGDYEEISEQSIGTFTLNTWGYIKLDGYFKFLFSDPVVKVASTLAVISSSDYELLRDDRYTALEAADEGSGKTIYAQLKITNATYAGVELALDCNNFGTYTDNEAVWTLCGENPQTAVDISAANGSVDLTQFESGGANELPAGSKVSFSWYDGDATYYCKPVSGGDFYNKFMPSGLAPGDGSSTFAWLGYGTGGLELRLRENQVDWDILTEGCFDKIPIADVGSQQNRIVYQNVDKTTKLYGSRVEASRAVTSAYGNIYASTGLDITFAYTFNAIPKVYYALNSDTGSATWAIARGWTATGTTGKLFLLDAVSISVTYTFNYEALGEWRD